MTAQMPINLINLSKDEFKDFIEKFDVIFCDCDGVLWSFISQLPGSVETINAFKNLKKRVYLITNNSQTTREDILDKSTKFGCKLSLDEIITSTYVTAQYLKQTGFNKTAYVIGPEALGRDLDKVGIKHIGIGPDPLEGSFIEHILKRYSLDADVGAVIVAFDGHFSFIKLCKAVNYLKNENVKFYATNSDNCINFPQFDFMLPEAGTLVSAIQAASKRKPEILSKPSTHVCDVVTKNSPEIYCSRTLVIGDTLSTDIIFGNDAGYSTLLVGTGVSTLKDVEDVVEKVNERDSNEDLKRQIPTYYIESLEAFYEKFLESF